MNQLKAVAANENALALYYIAILKKGENIFQPESSKSHTQLSQHQKL